MKKILAVLLVAAMMLSFAACASKEAAAPEAAAPEAAAPEAAAPEAEVTPIKIGMTQPLSDSNGLVGTSALRGAEIAVEEINEAGGVLGRPLELVVYDDLSSPEESVKLATKLIEVDKIDWASPSLLSTCILAAGQFYNEAGIITMATGTSSTWMQKGWEYLWRPSPASGAVMPQTAQYMKDLGIEKIAVFHGVDDSSASGALDLIAAAEALGIEILVNETYVDGDTDFSGQAIKIANSGCDAVFTSMLSTANASFAKQLRQAGYTGLVFNKEAPSMDNIKAADGALDNFAFIWPYVTYTSVDEISDSDARMKAFCERHLEKYGEMPYHDCCYRCYDAIYALAAAAEAAGSADSADMIEALSTKVNAMEGLAGTYDFTQGDQEGMHTYNAWIISDGKFVKFDQWIAEGGYDALKG